MRHNFYSYSKINCNLSRKKKVLHRYFTIGGYNVRKALHRIMSKQNLPWKDVDATSSEYIIHKHTLRDRTEVIAERNEHYKKKAEIINYLSLLSRMYILFKLFTLLQKLAVCSFPQIVNSRNLLFNS